ncbi:hypothetical protein CONLIGDRAFT_687857 [Coniochaeta ligniaria NRRL 30616]|uniref:Uncharacterized protein n=1 Tax=Coniochaeta ligniaria NRRL 30616 TaxID=1408157 RepID=A0A1J7ILV4_9PEZI|nr:hypothetical protein CONLIGDRAFT_687857 [Coniochaeta ligniaria NRRL 30616]
MSLPLLHISSASHSCVSHPQHLRQQRHFCLTSSLFSGKPRIRKSQTGSTTVNIFLGDISSARLFQNGTSQVSGLSKTSRYSKQAADVFTSFSSCFFFCSNITISSPHPHWHHSQALVNSAHLIYRHPIIGSTKLNSNIIRAHHHRPRPTHRQPSQSPLIGSAKLYYVDSREATKLISHQRLAIIASTNSSPRPSESILTVTTVSTASTTSPTTTLTTAIHRPTSLSASHHQLRRQPRGSPKRNKVLRCEPGSDFAG